MPAEPAPVPPTGTGSKQDETVLHDPRTEPRAARAMADMFDDVSGRYDLLNRVMALGRDQAWRRAMGAEVPESARVVLDLCTGSGVSLEGLRRPGRLVAGVDVSLRMLELAAARLDSTGWAPRLVCADAFHLPLASGALDAVTIAFGMRNLRPRTDALAEIARVLRRDGLLVVLEGTAPAPGPWAPFHRFYLSRLIPLAGRLSPDPSAYAYLGRSILEFGSGREFEADLENAGFAIESRRSFLLGATRLWVARRVGGETGSVQGARLGELPRGEMRRGEALEDRSWRWWMGTQLVLSAVLLASLLYALRVYLESGSTLPLEPWQRSGLRFLLVSGAVAFAVRTVVLWARFRGPRPRR